MSGMGSTSGVYYDFHKGLDFTLIFADCGEYIGYYSYGLWCLDKGYYETAYEYLKIAVYNRRDDSRYAMARLCYAMGRYEEAIQFTEMFAHEGCYSYNIFQAASYQKLGQSDKAIECLQDLINNKKEDLGYDDARLLLRGEFGIEPPEEKKPALICPAITKGIDKPFDEEPEAHKRYRIFCLIAFVLGILLTKLSFLYLILGLLPIGYYFYMLPEDKTDMLTIKDIDQMARIKNEKSICTYGSAKFFLSDEDDTQKNLYRMLIRRDLNIPKKGDYTDNQDRDYVHFGYASHNAWKRDNAEYEQAIMRWEDDIMRFVVETRKERAAFLLKRYSEGEKTAFIEDALKYLFDIEIVEGELKYRKRFLPWINEHVKIKLMQQADLNEYRRFLKEEEEEKGKKR